MEVASEVATKMVREELQRQKKRLQNTANGISKEPLLKTDIKTRTKQLGTRVATEVLESRALNTGLGAVLGTVTTAVSASMCKADEPLLNQRGKDIQKEENRKQQREAERQSAPIKMHR